MPSKDSAAPYLLAAIRQCVLEESLEKSGSNEQASESSLEEGVTVLAVRRGFEMPAPNHTDRATEPDGEICEHSAGAELDGLLDATEHNASRGSYKTMDRPGSMHVVALALVLITLTISSAAIAWLLSGRSLERPSTARLTPSPETTVAVADATAGEQLRAQLDSLNATVERLQRVVNDLKENLPATHPSQRPASLDIAPAAAVQSQTESEVDTPRSGLGPSEVAEAGQDLPAVNHRGKYEGDWRINLMSSADLASARRFETKLQNAGVQVALQGVDVDGQAYWRVQVTGFTSRGQAESTAQSLRERMGLTETWVFQAPPSD
ncbi:MAG: SPOR domain-containing protein [Pseudomonadota bacterium]